MKVNFTETVFRDANQSHVATRLSFDKFKPILSKMDKAGYYSVECWGGATFDSCLRFLNEDPWQRLRDIREAMPNTKLQMLLRGQNLLGYKHYPDDVVRKFVELSIRNGIDIIRIFDALNDPRNVKVAIEETVKHGAHASGAISYTTSPVHNLESNVKYAKELENMGVASICIKDMAGIMLPQDAYDLVKALKENVKVPIVVHTHSTAGLAFMTYLKAVEAGADVIDTATSCFSGGTSQPATETLVHALSGLGYDIDLDTKLLSEINVFFAPIRNEFIENGTLDARIMATDTACLDYEVPGGMLSNLVSQLKMQNAMDRFDDVLLEVPRVRADLGYPPLVTPMSQMVGVQATQNVLLGERYKSIGKEVKAYVRGEYGKAPAPIDEKIVKTVLGDEKPITHRPADDLEPLFEKTKAELGERVKCDEDVLSYIAFPQVAEKFFEKRKKLEENTVVYSIKRID